MSNVGINIKNLRKANQMTQLELAEKLGIKHNTLSDYESNRIEPRIHTLQIIANLFDVTIDELVGRTNEKVKMNQINNIVNLEINKDTLLELIENKLEDYISELPKQVLWDSNDLRNHTKMSWNTIKDTFFQDPNFPKFKVGKKWFFPAKEVEKFINDWALEKVKKDGS
jgi:transcriptional regulator with XRE-family HTH domain